MESTWVNTSLGLNLIPNFQQHDADDHHQADPKKKEFEEGANFAKFEGNHVSDVKQEAVGGGHVLLAEELSRISFENKKLAETLAGLCENYNTLQAHFKELMVSKQHSVDSSTYHHQNESSLNSKKRKAADHQDYNNININGFISGNTNETSCCTSVEEDPYSYKRPKDQNHINLKISRVYVQIDASDTRLIVKDGYQWRKYGQKVTRDNPSPRAYFKCSFAPTCPVKKKVQKSAENPSVLVATYEGEHNHMHPAGRSGEVTLIGSPTPFQAPNLIGSNSLLSSDNLASNRSLSSSPSVNHNMMCAHQEIEAPDPANFQQFLVQQMASSLTKDPNFTSTLAAAISAGRISINLDHTPMQKW